MFKRFHPKHLVILSLILAILSCSAPFDLTATPAPAIRSESGGYVLVSANPDSTATPTPFQPVTSTPRPTNLPTPTATVVVATALPTLIPTMRQVANPSRYPDGQVRVMVLGSDLRPAQGGFRTDVMMLVSINPKSGTATVLSFPRDLWVNIPGWGMNRINTAMVLGGFSLLSSTLESNFGFRPNYYVLANFADFTSIIDSLGGVDVVASTTLTDRCKFPQLKPDGITCVVTPGKHHMDGKMALWYVRSRHTTSDFDRERRAQEVLQAIFQKLFSVDSISKIPALFDFYRKNVETNIGLDAVVNLAPTGIQLLLDSGRVRRYTIGPGQVSDFTTDNGWMVLVPNDAAIYSIILQAVFTP